MDRYREEAFKRDCMKVYNKFFFLFERKNVINHIFTNKELKKKNRDKQNNMDMVMPRTSKKKNDISYCNPD